MLQYAIVCCSVLQCLASVFENVERLEMGVQRACVLQNFALCCRCVAGVLQVRCSVLHYLEIAAGFATHCNTLQHVVTH